MTTPPEIKCFALSAYLVRVNVSGTAVRLVTGYRYADNQESAIGPFMAALRGKLKDGFTLGGVGAIEIPPYHAHT